LFQRKRRGREEGREEEKEREQKDPLPLIPTLLNRKK